MKKTKIQALMKRLRQIEPIQLEPRPYYIALFKEHFRLLVNFAKSQGFEMKYAKPGVPFRTLINREMPELLNERRKIEQMLKEQGLTWAFFRRDVYISVIAWESLFGETENITNPYLPLIILFERGVPLDMKKLDGM